MFSDCRYDLRDAGKLVLRPFAFNGHIPVRQHSAPESRSFWLTQTELMVVASLARSQMLRHASPVAAGTWRPIAPCSI